MMAALFVLFCIEMWLNSKTGGHSHGGATGQDIVPSGHHGHSHGHNHARQQGDPHVHGITAPVAMQAPSPYDNASLYSNNYENDRWIDEKKAYAKEYVVSLPLFLFNAEMQWEHPTC